MKEKLKKHDNLILAIIILLISISYTLMLQTATGDEIWNFQNVCKMINGYILYNDANVIVTPIFFIIANLILKTFGSNILIFRLYGAIIYTAFILLIYNILKALKLQKREALMYTFLIHISFYKILDVSANYNLLAIVFVLLGILASIKFLGQNKFNIINGIVIFLVLFTKQNIGAYYLIGTILAQLIIEKYNKNRGLPQATNLNKAIINIVKQLFISTVLIIISVLLMKLCGNLEGFIDYCILGIREFANNNISSEITTIVYLILACVISIFAIIITKINKNNISIKNTIILLLSIGIPLLLVSYPIANLYHTLLATVVLIILLIYMLHISILKDFLTKKLMNIVIGVVISISVLIAINKFGKYAQYIKLNTSYDNPYYGAILLPEAEQKIEKVNNYIKENNEKVIIFNRRCSNL